MPRETYWGLAYNSRGLELVTIWWGHRQEHRDPEQQLRA